MRSATSSLIIGSLTATEIWKKIIKTCIYLLQLLMKRPHTITKNELQDNYSQRDSGDSEFA
jgi:hypothetical protein